MPRMEERELISLIQAHEGRAYGWGDGVLAIARAESIRRFLAKPYGNEQEGRSSIVSTDLRDTVLWIVPQVMRAVMGGDEICKFDPTTPKDEAQATLETGYINHIMLERNPAYATFSAVVQDALVSGNGYAKVWWDKKEDVQIERYFGKGDDELNALMSDPDVEVAEHSQYPDPEYVPPPPQPQMTQGPQGPMPMMGPDGQPVMMPPPPPPNLHDVVLRRKRVTEYARYEAVPPEEILIGAESRNLPLQQVDFVQHRKEMSLSEIRQMGYKVDDEIADQFGDSDPRHSQEEIARNRFSSEYIPGAGDDAVGPAMRKVVFRETYLRVDWDGDGIGELRKVCHIGTNVLANEETDSIPLVSFVAIPFAHRHHGISHHELIRDIAEARTEIIRSYLDGLKVNVRPRLAIDSARVNRDDLLVARPNALVRTQGSPAESIMPLPVADTGGMAMQGLQWLDAWRMDASGINQAMQSGQSIDASSLNQTALGMSQQISMAMARVENITRSIADGVRDLVLLLHATTLHNASKAEHIRLNNQWSLVDPREWVRRDRLTVTVGLGSGTREMRAQQLMALVGQLTQLAATPLNVVKPQNIYNAVSRLTQELGYRNPEEFVSNPATQQPPPPPPPDPIVQAEQIKSQATIQVEQIRQQHKAQEMQQRAQLDAQQAQISVQQSQAEAQMQAELEREKARIKAEADVTVARMKAEIDAQTAVQLKQMELQAQGVSLEVPQAIEQHRAGVDAIMQAMGQMTQMMSQIVQEHQRRATAKVVRDARGKVAGTVDQAGVPIAIVERDQNGRVAGYRPQ